MQMAPFLDELGLSMDWGQGERRKGESTGSFFGGVGFRHGLLLASHKLHVLFFFSSNYCCKAPQAQIF